jgi:hypothetical protein
MKKKMVIEFGVANINENKRATMENVRKKKLKMTFSDVRWIELQMCKKVEVK